MLKQYFRRITLFTILAFLSLAVFIIVAVSRQPEEIKSDLLRNLLIALALFVSVDVLLKQILKLRTVWMWCLQILLVLIAVYLWIIHE